MRAVIQTTALLAAGVVIGAFLAGVLYGLLRGRPLPPRRSRKD